MTRYRVVPHKSRLWAEARSSLHPVNVETAGLTGYVEAAVNGHEVFPRRRREGARRRRHPRNRGREGVIDMQDYGLVPPKLLMFRVYPEVKVRAKLVAVREG